MKLSIVILLTLAASINAAISGYKYQQPQGQVQHQHQHQRPSIQPLPLVQSPPVNQYKLPAQTPQLLAPAPPAISLPPPPPPQSQSAPLQIVAAPAPAYQPQTQYLAPQQQHHYQQQQQQQVLQQQSYSQQSVQQFAQQQNLNVPQNHQPVFEQVLSPQINNRPQTAIITKDIFIHSAPEDYDFELNSAPQYESGPVRKNYRIVFIKAPSTNLRNAAAALQRVQAQNEEKTVIYVLSKKPDLSEVHQQLQQSQGEQRVNKPEVYFIKYKTQEEAQRAQQEIQAQYDALGGTSRITDEGVAPIASVGSLKLGGPIGGSTSYQQSSLQQQAYQSQSGPAQEYLPPRAVKK